MLWMMEWLRAKLTVALARLQRRRATLPTNPPNPQPAPPPDDPLPDYGTDVVKVPANRATRRALERRRRRHDKFVTPRGELPERLPAKPRAKRVAKVKPVEVVDDVVDAEIFIAGRHHEDTEEVLYKEAEYYGEFHFRDTILQQLERYFVYLARMRRTDADTYQLYRQYGATIMPYVSINAHNREHSLKTWDLTRTTPLADWFHRTRPMFGCYAYGADPESERYEKEMSEEMRKDRRELWIPKFMYFTKFKRAPCGWERISGGDTYGMTVWWDRPFSTRHGKAIRKYGTPQEYGIWISDDGKEVVALRSLVNEKVRIKGKTGEYRGRTFSIPRKTWKIPTTFAEWAQEEGDTPERFLRELFLETVQRHSLHQLNMVRVSASKGDMTASFSVDIHKMSYFFQDRDIYATSTGARKRVFHMVRPHVRDDGTKVKTHFRGQREFTWAGYDVRITIPGRDHNIFDDMDIGAIDIEDADGRPVIDNEQLGARLANAMRKTG
jgi:hypothetical protein